MTSSPTDLSIILPARNEAPGLCRLLPELRAAFPDAEILVVDDASSDATAEVCRAQGVRVVRHPQALGNGAAIKTGARHAQGEVLVCMDADGQHDPADISRLLAKLDEGYAMVVGARKGRSHATWARRGANYLFNRLASVMTGYRIEDLTSGFRAVQARHFRRFLYLLPNGFSYPTTITMAFFRSGLPLGYIPIEAGKRDKKTRSKIRLFRDGVRFILIIMKIGTLFSPMRFFLPISGLLFLSGLGLYGYTYYTEHRFTNMGAVLFLSSLITFLIGVLAELVASLHYRSLEEDARSELTAQRLEYGVPKPPIDPAEPIF